MKHALELSATRQVFFCSSVNAEAAIKKWKTVRRAQSACFTAARHMKAAGWRFRFQLDPMVPWPDWQRGKRGSKTPNSLSIS
jgi:hypothetical protein